MQLARKTDATENPDTVAPDARATEQDVRFAPDRVLINYFRDVGRKPMLDRDAESRCATELAENRRDFVEIVRGLQPDHAIVQDDAELEGRLSLDRIEEVHRRVRALAKEVDEPETLQQIREAGRLKRRIDACREQLIVANLRFVIHVVRDTGARKVPFMDLVQEGALGLMEAVDRFDHERGYRFVTYAYWWIRRAISEAIARKSTLIRIPTHTRERLGRLREVTRVLNDELGRKPTTGELGEHMNLSIEKVEELMAVVSEPEPLEFIDKDGGVQEPARSIADPNSENPLKQALFAELKAKLDRALRRLPSREETVLRLRFGLGGKSRLTLSEVGKSLRVTRERARQIERDALIRLQDTPEGRDLHRYLPGIH